MVPCFKVLNPSYGEAGFGFCGLWYAPESSPPASGTEVLILLYSKH